MTSQCLYFGDGCSKCEISWDALEWNVVCPDFCGPGRTLTYIQLVSYVEYCGVPLPVFTIVTGVSGCMDQDKFEALLEWKEAYIYNFSTAQTLPEKKILGTWSCPEVCHAQGYAAGDNDKSGVAATSPVNDARSTSAARIKARTLGHFVMVLLKWLC